MLWVVSQKNEAGPSIRLALLNGTAWSSSMVY